MARTLEKIREHIGTLILGQPELVAALGLNPDQKFEEQVSSANILKLLTEVVASGIYFHEQIFDRDKEEMLALLNSKKPHQLQWYRDKALNFQFGPDGMRNLLPDSDVFDNSDIQASDYEQTIAREKIVKYAAAVERGNRVQIKVAKGGESDRQPLDKKEQRALESYFAQIKDAGVIIEVINQPADEFRIAMDIYYDPIILNQDGMRLDGLVNDPIRTTIRKFVQNLPFDSVYKNMDLVDELQKIPGVVIPELKHVEYRYGGRDWMPIDAKRQPDSGYFKVAEDGGLNLNFIAYVANN